jgi:hypothetical protein
MSTNKALAAASALALGLAPATALAHTNSIGYVGDGQGGITFWYGSWHSGTNFNEAEIKLEGANSTTFGPTITQFTLLQSSTPAGLIPGTNYFTSDGTQLIPYDPNNWSGGGESYTWQGVTFTGLSAGDYTFTYIPLGDPESYNPAGTPTMDWAPMDQVIRSATVTLSSSILSGDANLNGIPDVQEFGTVVTPPTPSTPTLVSSAPGTPHVHTMTSTQDRYVFNTAGDTRTYYQDTVTTTHTTPTTVDTYSDGSTVTTNGTMVTTTSVTQSTVPVWVETRTYSVAYGAYAPSGAAPTVVNTHRYTATESGNTQKVNHHTTTGTTTPTVRSVTTTEVYTRVYTDGTADLVTTGNSVVTSENSTSYAETYASRDYFGRIDQLEVMDSVSNAVGGLLNHEASPNWNRRFRVFENNRFVQSYNADGYNADSKVFGGGFEYDLTKGWTFGAQYNQVNINLNGVDSRAQQKKQHVGIFNTLHGNTLSLNTNAAMAFNNYNYNRTVEGVFDNAGETTGQEWWVSNRLYLHATKWLKPFVGHTVSNVKRNAYTETGDTRSARSVEAVDNTTHVGEAGLKLETRFGGKKKDLFGVSVEGAYGTDNSYGVTAEVDYREVIAVEATHGVADGITTNSITGKVKFRF